jgi:imidazolonepropionase
MKLIGPFKQVVTLANLPLRGKLSDEQLEIIVDGGIVVDNDTIQKIGNFETLKTENPDIEIEKKENRWFFLLCILIPIFVLEETVRMILQCVMQENLSGNCRKWRRNLEFRTAYKKCFRRRIVENFAGKNQVSCGLGITTIEVKSGYGLDVENELKMLSIIKKAQESTKATLVPTCLSAHLKPRDFEGSNPEYLEYILTEILPKVKEEDLPSV